MRIYEYAKKYKVTSKELLGLLSGKGFDFASHMSVLTSEAIVFLDGKFSNKTAPKAIVDISKEKKH